MWIKYKHQFAWGTDGEWEYIEIPNMDKLIECGYDHLNEDDRISEWLYTEEGISDEYENSESYRGLEFFKINNPPYEYLERNYMKYLKIAENYKEKATYLKKLMDEIAIISDSEMRL